METKIKELEVQVTLSFASRVRYNERGYAFPLEYIREKRKVVVKVSDLQPKSNVKITRICVGCSREQVMTFHKARLSPLCHSCITKTIEFSRKTSIATQRALIGRGKAVQARTLYLNKVGNIPDSYVVHHIDMDDSHNVINNLIPLSRSQHHITHGTLNRLCRELIERNVIKFNQETLSYEMVR